MFRIRTTLTSLCLCAAFAVAGQSHTLVFENGKKKSVTLASFDADGLTVSQGDRESRVAWSELHPRSAYAARKALTSYDDAPARLELSEFARVRKLFPEALEQLEVALALGALDEAAFERREKEIEAEEVKFLTGRIDLLLGTGSRPRDCLAAIKRLKERYPDHDAIQRYEPHVQKLVDALAQEAEQEQAAEDKAEDDAATARIRKQLAKLLKEKTAALERAKVLRKEGAEAAAKGQISRVRKRLDVPRGAVRYYKAARQALRSMAKVDREFRVVVKAELRKEDEALEKEIIACYLEIARTLMSQRNYKGAKTYVIKVLRLDPINEEALDMAKEIQKNRITFKISDITNARPRVTGG